MKRRIIAITAAALVVLSLSVGGASHAATVPNGDFSLEVSPSPLVATVETGHSTTLDLKVHNASQQSENLKIEARGFTIAHPGEQITISTTTPPDLLQWVSFSEPKFTLNTGEWKTQKITITLPEAAGFSYPFVIVVSRATDPAKQDGGAALKGSIAVFTLVNIDKPGATRKLEIDSFQMDRHFYEYLPATFKIKLKNSGNSIVQPYGNLYVQTPGKESEPLAVLPMNQTASYILPGSIKAIDASWADGFPVYKSVTNKDGKEDKELVWNWDNIAHFRFGHYTAKLVAVYNDGTRDVPVVGEVSFWIIPWRILLGVLVVLLLVGFAIWTILRRLTHHAGMLVNRSKKSS